MKTRAFLYYFFSGLFFTARVFQNLGGKFNFIAMSLIPLFSLVWFVLLAYGLIKYRKLPLLVLFSVPFITFFTFRYTEPIIFRYIQLPYFQQALKDIDKIEYVPNYDYTNIQSLENIKTPFTFGVERLKIPKTNTFIVQFIVGSTGALGTHWGYVYCSDEKTNVENISEFKGKVYRYDGNWYEWAF